MAGKNVATKSSGNGGEVVVPLARGLQTLSEEEMREMEGMEGVGVSDRAEDRGTPLLYIAQKSSKAVNPKEPKYVEGLKVGMAFNPRTGRMWDAEKIGVPFIPCFFQVTWNEWTPQEEGGGFHGQHHRDTPLLRSAKAVPNSKGDPRRDLFLMDNGHELVLTHNYYGIIEDTLDHMAVSMSSTNLGCSTSIQSMLDEQKAQTAEGRIVKKPAYFSRLLLKTVYDKNDAGDWYRWVAQFAGRNEDSNLRSYCRKIAEAGLKGQLRADMSEETAKKDDEAPI